MAFQFLDSLINGPSTSYENTSDNEDESDKDLDESALVDLPDSIVKVVSLGLTITLKHGLII